MVEGICVLMVILKEKFSLVILNYLGVSNYSNFYIENKVKIVR